MSRRRKHDPTVDVPRLYGALAEGIVRAGIDIFQRLPVPRHAVAGKIEPVRARKGDGIIGNPDSTFERVAWVFHEMGVAVTPDLANPYAWTLAVDGVEVANFVAKRVQDGTSYTPPIDELLSIFVGCAGHHGLIKTDEGEIFAGDANLQGVFAELHHAGFLGRMHGQWRWTRRAATAMQMDLAWPHDEEAEAGPMAAGDPDAELREMLATMPEDVRKLGREFYPGRFWLALSHRWKARQWGPAPVPGEHVVLNGSYKRASRLMELIKLEDYASEEAIS